MADVRIEHVFNCSEDTFWDKIFFDDEFNRRLYSEALEFPVFDVEANDDRGDSVSRVTNVVPKLGPMPGPLKKLIGDGLGYKEEGTYEKKTRRYTTTITPNKLADKMKIKGLMYTEAAGDGKCTRIFECNVVAKVFGVGGLLEKQIIGDMKTSYDKAAEFTNQYISEKSL